MATLSNFLNSLCLIIGVQSTNLITLIIDRYLQTNIEPEHRARVFVWPVKACAHFSLYNPPYIPAILQSY